MFTKFFRKTANKTIRKLALKLNREIWHKATLDRGYNHKLSRKPGLRMINIGAGAGFNDNNFVSLDFNPLFTKTLRYKFPYGERVYFDLMDPSKGIPFDDLDIVYSSHTIEHVPIADVLRILHQIHLKMKEGAIFRLVVPDADLILDAFKRNDLNFFCFYRSYFGIFEPTLTDYVFLFLHTGLGRIVRGKPNIAFKEEVYIEFEKLKGVENLHIINWFNSLKIQSDPMGTYHQTSFNFQTLAELLRQAGFKNIYRSAFMQSREIILREVPKFDGTHPWMSLYIEGYK